MFPSHAKLFLAPYSDTDYFSSYVNYWDDVYGVNMGCIRPKAVQWMVAEPYVENTEPKAVAMAKPVVILVRRLADQAHFAAQSRLVVLCCVVCLLQPSSLLCLKRMRLVVLPLGH